MGMFDSLYDEQGREWQTKAFGNVLAEYRTGELLPGPPFAYQFKILGGGNFEEGEKFMDAFATADEDGRLASFPDERDVTLPLLDYHGGWVKAGNS